MKLPDLNLIVHCHCEKATELASESLERKLTFSERWAMWLHALICKSCRRAIRQIKTLRSFMKEVPDSLKQTMAEDSSELSPSAKSRIAEAMKRSN